MYNRVIESSKNIRALAREALRGKWGTAVAATLVYVLALSVPAYIIDVMFGGEDFYSPLSALYTFLVAAPFTLGYSIFCLNILRNREIGIGQVFFGFEHFFKVMSLYLVMCLFIFLWSLLFIIPGIIAAYRYSQAFFILADHPEYGALQCLNESKAMMIGNKFKILCLEISFIGWLILAAIPSGIIEMIGGGAAPMFTELVALIAEIPVIPVTAYLMVASAVFYDMANGRLRTGFVDIGPLHREEEQ